MPWLDLWGIDAPKSSSLAKDCHELHFLHQFDVLIDQLHGERISGAMFVVVALSCSLHIGVGLKTKRPRGIKHNKEWMAHLIKKGLDDYIAIVKFDSHFEK